MSCEDQAITLMPKSCTKWPCCNTPEESSLVENSEGFMVCPLCYASYGKLNYEDVE
jgi:hypothetical protein